jgi:hypothetical protein
VRTHVEMKMATPDDRAEEHLDDLEPETVEDLDVDEGAEDVAGGTKPQLPDLLVTECEGR